jgi:hypothetical protein
MKKLIFLSILIPLTVLAAKRRFNYSDCVIVVSGFYKDCRGFTTRYSEIDNTYVVSIDECHNNSFMETFKDSELKACN